MFGISTLRCDFTFQVGVVAAFATFSVPGVAWAVGSTPVTVVNPEDIAKAEGIQQPYQTRAFCTFTTSDPHNCFAEIFSPQSQRLVIEFVSGSCAIPASDGNNVLTATIGTTSGGNFVDHTLVTQPPVPTLQGTEFVIMSQQVRLYADPSSIIQFSVNTASVSNPDNCQFNLSGQAVTAK
jgi:hypothetical protein